MQSRWLLDAGVVVVLQRTRELSLLEPVAKHGQLLVVEDVYDELAGRKRQPKTPDQHARANEARAFMDTWFEKREVSLDHPALVALRGARTTVRGDVGEDASIAWALDETDVTFVTNDVMAAGRALRELPGRVAMTHDLLRHIVALDPLLASRAISVSARAAEALREKPSTWGSQEPLWWSQWIEGLGLTDMPAGSL